MLATADFRHSVAHSNVLHTMLLCGQLNDEIFTMLLGRASVPTSKALRIGMRHGKILGFAVSTRQIGRQDTCPRCPSAHQLALHTW